MKGRTRIEQTRVTQASSPERAAVLLIFGALLTLGALVAIYYNIESSAMGVRNITDTVVPMEVAWGIGAMITLSQLIFWLSEDKQGLELSEIMFGTLLIIDVGATYYRINNMTWWNASTSWLSNVFNFVLTVLFFSIGAEIMFSFGVMTIVRNGAMGRQGLSQAFRGGMQAMNPHYPDEVQRSLRESFEPDALRGASYRGKPWPRDPRAPRVRR